MVLRINAQFNKLTQKQLADWHYKDMDEVIPWKIPAIFVSPPLIEDAVSSLWSIALPPNHGQLQKIMYRSDLSISKYILKINSGPDILFKLEDHFVRKCIVRVTLNKRVFIQRVNTDE